MTILNIISILTPLIYSLNYSNRLLVAVSGGVDSVALLAALARGKLAQLAPHAKGLPNAELAVAHFDHASLHGESAAHAEFVRTLAAQLELPFFYARSPEPLADEAAARAARYAFLAAAAREFRADKIVLAHHADDQAETVLLRLVRGAGLPGLASMREIAPNPVNPAGAPLWRPLLGVPKTTLESFIATEKLSHITDPSNASIHFARNFLRLKVLPQLTELNPQIVTALARTATAAGEAADYIAEQACDWIRKNAQEKTVPLAAFRALHPALAATVLRQIHATECGHARRFEAVHFTEVLQFGANPAGGKYQKFGELIFHLTKRGNERVLAWELAKTV